MKGMMIILVMLILGSVSSLAYDVIILSGTIDLLDDSDNDGVVDTIDKCPDTPMGFITDNSGCSSRQYCDLVKIRYTIKKNQIIINPTDYWKCVESDWLSNELDKRFPSDCQVVYIKKPLQVYCTNTKQVN